MIDMEAEKYWNMHNGILFNIKSENHGYMEQCEQKRTVTGI